MKFRRVVSILLCISMVFCSTLSNFATGNLNLEETTKESSEDNIVEPTKVSIEGGEVSLATNSEAEEEEDLEKEYETEKESDEEESVTETSSEESNSIEGTDATKETEEETSIEETSEETTSEEVTNEQTVSEETTCKEAPSENINEVEISSPSEIEDDVLFGTDEVSISTNSEVQLDTIIEENTIVATFSNVIIEEKVIATKSTVEKKQINNYGYIPSKFKVKPAKKGDGLFGGLMKDEQIPSSYDAREHTNASGMSIVPPVRNQGNYGTCWAFSTIGMFETSLRSKNLVSNEEDSNLSEAALAYFTLDLKDVTSSDTNLDKPGYEGKDRSEINVDYFESWGMGDNANFADSGGNQVEPILMASTYMGVVKENEDTNYGQMGTILANGLDGKYAFNSNDFEIANAQFINKDDTDIIKKAIMKNGSVAANYCEARDMYNCHKFGDDYYYLSFWWNEGRANHAIMIVGWDDNIPKENFYTEDPFDDDEDDSRQATRNGGWLIRNSWGPSNNLMNGGYFWISYDDKSIENTFYTVEAIQKDTYKYNYHYDTSGNDHDSVLSGVPIANVFKVSDDEDQLLEAVNVALNDASDIDIEIYTSNNKMNSPVDGKKVLTQHFSTATGGVFTINLNDDIFVKKGTYFSIVIVPVTTGVSMFIDNLLIYEASPRTFYNEIALGQSFYQNNEGTAWIDLNSSETRNIDGVTYGKNYRIRALTNPTEIGITFNANGGEGKMTRQGAVRGNTVNIDKNQFTRLGYVFVGWRDANDRFYNDGDKITINDNITLYAQWEEAYKITFVGNGGSYNGELEYIQYVRKNSEVTLESCKFVYSGYSFNKWTSNGKSYANGATIAEVSGDMVLTATWTKNKAPSNPGGTGPSGGGGGGGGGGGKALDQLPSKPAETTVATDLSSTPINFNTANSTWSAGSDGKWHLNVVNANGVVEEVKNQWACISKTVDINGQQVTVQDLYYFDENGNMLTGWLTDSMGKKYFLDNDMKELGKLTRGWKKIENNYYFFDDKGILFTSGITPDGYTVTSTGVWLP